MKKYVFFILSLLLFSSLSTTALANKKKDKNKNNTEQPVKLVTPSDSTSYAAGYAASDGLLPYLIGRLHVDTAYMADFIRGYNETLAKAKDPANVAYLAGCNIATQAADQILPNMSRDLVGTNDSITSAPFHEGFLAGVKQDTAVYKMADARKRYETRTTEARNLRNSVYKKENEEWLKNNATKPGVITTASGLQYKVLKEGNGPKPKATDKVQVIYEGKTIDDKVFDATERHGGKKTDTFRCDQVIKGWTEALTNMNVGSKWEIYIPQNLAYGEREAGQIKPFSTLIFTVELVGIEADDNANTDNAAKTEKNVKTVKAAKSVKPAKTVKSKKK